VGLNADTRIGNEGPTHMRKIRKGTKRLGNAKTPPVYVSTKDARAALEELHALAPSLWRPIDRAFRGEWLKHRLREYVNVHGYASAGVCTLLEKAAAAYADVDYMRAIGMQQNDMAVVMMAHKLSVIAKGLELAAYEIAMREGRAKAELDALNSQSGQRLATALKETSDERKGRKKAPEFGGLVFTADDPWPGVDGNSFPLARARMPDNAEPLESTVDALPELPAIDDAPRSPNNAGKIERDEITGRWRPVGGGPIDEGL